MIRISLRDTRQLYPFNEHARDIRVQNKPLWLHHRDALAPYVEGERQAEDFEELFSPLFQEKKGECSNGEALCLK